MSIRSQIGKSNGSFVKINTDAVGKENYEVILDNCQHYAGELNLIYQWLTDIEKLEKLENVETCQDLTSVKKLMPITGFACD